MQQIIVIVGLPGSGKTHLAQELAHEHEAFVYDDVNLEEDFFELKNDLLVGSSVILTTPFIYNEGDAKRLTSALYDLCPLIPEPEFIWFENDPDQCRINATARLKDDPTKTVVGFIREMSVRYTPPVGANIMEVYTP